MNDEKNVVWRPPDSPSERLARVETKLHAIHSDVQEIKKFVGQHHEDCPAKVHSAYFKLMGATLVILGSAVVAVAIKVFWG